MSPHTPCSSLSGVCPGSWCIGKWCHVTKTSHMSPTGCRWGKVFADLFYKSYVCVLELVTDHQAQAAAVLQTPNIVLSHAGHTFRSKQAYAICFFFPMVKTCSKWSLEVLPRVPGASALRCPGAADRAA